MSGNCVLVAQLCLTLCDSMIGQQALLSMKFSRQEYWSGLSFPTPGSLPDSGTEPRSPALHCMTLPLPPLSSMHNLRYKNYFGK